MREDQRHNNRRELGPLQAVAPGPVQAVAPSEVLRWAEAGEEITITVSGARWRLWGRRGLVNG